MTRPRGSVTLRRPARIVTPADEVLYLEAAGREVRRVRQERGVSVQAIATTIGVAPSAIHRFEAGCKPQAGPGRGRTLGPTLRTLIRIARALDVQPSELLP